MKYRYVRLWFDLSSSQIVQNLGEYRFFLILASFLVLASSNRRFRTSNVFDILILDFNDSHYLKYEIVIYFIDGMYP